jgi:hypothetical protein
MACRMRRTVVCVEQVTGPAAARGRDFAGGGAGRRKGSGAVQDCRRAYLDLERAQWPAGADWSSCCAAGPDPGRSAAHWSVTCARA